jgi:hypothetical protein
VSNPTIKFTVYETAKRVLEGYKEAGSKVTAFEAFLLGAFASAVATAVTYPVQVVQTKTRVNFQL